MTTAQLRAPIDVSPAGIPRMAPTAFRILTAGKNDSDQGTFIFDDEAAAFVLDAFRGRGRDLVIDYEHQSVADPPIKAPAAGWMRLTVRNGELWAVEVVWTSEARQEIEAGKYRYISPVFKFDKDTRQVGEVFNVGLTNNPSLHHLVPLVAASSPFGRTNQSGGPIMLKAKTLSWRRNADNTITCSTAHGEITLPERELRDQGFHPDQGGPGPNAFDKFEVYVNFQAQGLAQLKSGSGSPAQLARLRTMFGETA
jgi:hypothetical protein